MASSTMRSTGSLTICGICNTEYVDPRILSCSHTYCLRCIKQNAATHNDQFECPLNDGTKVTKNRIDALPVNQTMRDVIDYLALDSGSIRCSNCDSAPSEYWCDKCINSYCAACRDKIHRIVVFRNHEIVRLEDKPVELISCKKHPDEKLKYWCEKCTTFVCSDCLLHGHKDHPYAGLNKVAKKIEETVKNDLSDIELSLDGKVKDTDRLLTSVNDEHRLNKRMITETMEHLRQVINEHEKEISEKIDKIKRNENELMNDIKTRLENELESLHKQQKILAILLNSKDDTKLMRANQGCIFYIKRINRILDELRLPAKHEYNVKGIELMQTIRENILECGRLEDLRRKSDGKTYQNSQLEKLLADNQTKEELDLGAAILTDRDMEIVADALQNNTGLTKLRLPRSQIDDQGTEHLAAALKHNKTLTTLELYDNKIGDHGAQYLADALQENTALTTLDLYQNEISDQGIQYLANVLRQNRTLTTLHLSENRIGDEGAEYLADALRHNKRLKAIHLSQNEIGDKGARHLADALKHNKTLTVLNLYWNDISDDGAKYFADALKQNGTLTTLYLSNNQIGDDGALQLADALQRNRTLTTLSLHQNPIDQKAQQTAKDILKANNHVTVSW